MLTLVCYNIHWCVGTDNQYDPHRTKCAIVEANGGNIPDIVCLQEVHQYTSAFPHDDQASVLAQFLGFNYMCFGATMTGSPKSKDDVGHYGNAIISRYPLTFLGTLPFNNDRQKEPRSALAVCVHCPLGNVNVITLHLDVSVSGGLQYNSVMKLLQWDIAKTAHVICGDFNYFGFSKALSAMRTQWSDAWLLYGKSLDNKRENYTLYIDNYDTDNDDSNSKNCTIKKLCLSCLSCLPCLSLNVNKKNDKGLGKCTYFDGCTRNLLRIDYIFVGTAAQVSSCRVYRKGLAKVASDHAPILLEFYRPY